MFAALFTKLNLRRSSSSLRASACCLSLINVGSRVGVPIVQGEVKGLKEFDQLITEESKLKKSHSAISFILKLCKVSSLFIFSSFSIESSVMRWALLGGLCSTGGLGVGDWEAVCWWVGGLELEVGGGTLLPKPRPRHQAPARRAPQPLISKFITSSGNLSSTEVFI